MNLEQVARTPYGRAAAQVCRAWGLTDTEAEALLRSPERPHLVIGINALLADLYSGDLPAMWMTIPNVNPTVGGTEGAPVRPVDHAIESETGLEDVWRLLTGYAEGK